MINLADVIEFFASLNVLSVKSVYYWLISFALIAHWCIGTVFSKIKHETPTKEGTYICLNVAGSLLTKDFRQIEAKAF